MKINFNWYMQETTRENNNQILKNRLSNMDREQLSHVAKLLGLNNTDDDDGNLRELVNSAINKAKEEQLKEVIDYITKEGDKIITGFGTFSFQGRQKKRERSNERGKEESGSGSTDGILSMSPGADQLQKQQNFTIQLRPIPSRDQIDNIKNGADGDYAKKIDNDGIASINSGNQEKVNITGVHQLGNNKEPFHINNIRETGVREPVTLNVRNTPADNKNAIVSKDSNGNYVVIESIELMNIPAKADKSLVGSNKFYCFQDSKIAKQYTEMIQESEQKLAELKEKYKEANGKGDYSEVKRINDQMNVLNKEIQAAYNQREKGRSAFNGFCVTRKDRNGKETNLVGGTSSIDIQTMGLDETSAARINMGKFYFEMHFNEHGELDEKNMVTPLTAEGSKQARLFNDGTNDPNLVYNNYEKVLAELDQLKEFKVNGKDVLGKIKEQIKAMSDKTKQQEQKPDIKKDDVITGTPEQGRVETPVAASEKISTEEKGTNTQKDSPLSSINPSETGLDIGSQPKQETHTKKVLEERQIAKDPLDIGVTC